MLAGIKIAPSAQAEDQYDFSENNLATNTSYWDPSGFIRSMDDGGNSVIAASYFARWAGPVFESDDPFPESGKGEDMSYCVRNAAFHVQDMAFLPTRKDALDNDEIKKAIMNYGAVFAPFLVYDSSIGSFSVNFPLS